MSNIQNPSLTFHKILVALWQYPHFMAYEIFPIQLGSLYFIPYIYSIHNQAFWWITSHDAPGFSTNQPSLVDQNSPLQLRSTKLIQKLVQLSLPRGKLFGRMGPQQFLKQRIPTFFLERNWWKKWRCTRLRLRTKMVTFSVLQFVLTVGGCLHPEGDIYKRPSPQNPAKAKLVEGNYQKIKRE